ncbi:hypothetical protein BZA77DRAFT_128583 [Pyronema omphalodes]|nr:hypothetical protein BZA77DRAFT_128583 [Pyronema omphalodes]
MSLLSLAFLLSCLVCCRLLELLAAPPRGLCLLAPDNTHSLTYSLTHSLPLSPRLHLHLRALLLLLLLLADATMLVCSGRGGGGAAGRCLMPYHQPLALSTLIAFRHTLCTCTDFIFLFFSSLT